MNAEIKKIFGESIMVDGTEVPVAHLKYKGNSRTYVIWGIISEKGELYADDEPVASSVLVDVDVYSDGNYIKTITEIKKLMKNNDWMWVEDSQEMFDEDTGLYHKTLTFTKEGEIKWQE